LVYRRHTVKRIGVLIILIIASVALCTGTALADDQKRIVGVWRFVNEVDTKADGTPAPPAAASPDSQGLLIYTADGFMAVNIMPKGRTWSADSATIEELRDTVDGGAAYSGRYTIDNATHTVTHTTAVCMNPAYQGKSLMRSYAFKNGDLELSGTFPWKSDTIHFAITWRRAD
jgi:hypothetical protein